MFRAVLKAVFVFLFMAFLAAQASTGFMRELFAGSVYPRALRAFDWVLETVFTGPLGPTGGAIALLVLGAFCAVLIIRREIKENSPVEVAGSANVRGSGDDSAAKVLED